MEKRPLLKASIRKSIQEKGSEMHQGAVNLIEASYLSTQDSLPLVIQPVTLGVNLADWVASNQGYICSELARHGAILFRNFNVDSSARFEEAARAVVKNGELFDEYGDLPREQPGAKVYKSTPYPADKMIKFHNESSHMHCWPMKIFFFCVKQAEEGGATPILDCRRAYTSIDPSIIKRMTEKKLMYVRNFIEGLDVSWQQFFQTSDKKKVEDYCRKASIDFQWHGEKHLTTRQICQAVAKHPQTGDMLFFNQIQLHHVSCLDAEIKTLLLSMFPEENLPRNLYYGDGTLIEDSIISEVNHVYDELAVRFQWQKGDVIMLDNMMVAHARDPFQGTRKILVAMAEIMSQRDLLSIAV